MTPEELLEALQGLAVKDPYGYLIDAESVHAKADRLLGDVLVDLGYSEAVEFFRSLDLWYA